MSIDGFKLCRECKRELVNTQHREQPNALKAKLNYTAYVCAEDRNKENRCKACSTCMQSRGILTFGMECELLEP